MVGLRRILLVVAEGGRHVLPRIFSGTAVDHHPRDRLVVGPRLQDVGRLHAPDLAQRVPDAYVNDVLLQARVVERVVDGIGPKGKDPLRVESPPETVAGEIDVHPVALGGLKTVSIREDSDEFVALGVGSRRVDEHVGLDDRAEQDIVRPRSVPLVDAEVRLAPDAAVIRLGIAQQTPFAGPHIGRDDRIPHLERTAVLGHVPRSGEPPLLPRAIAGECDARFRGRVHAQGDARVGLDKLTVDEELPARADQDRRLGRTQTRAGEQQQEQLNQPPRGHWTLPGQLDPENARGRG